MPVAAYRIWRRIYARIDEKGARRVVACFGPNGPLR